MDPPARNRSSRYHPAPRQDYRIDAAAAADAGIRRLNHGTVGTPAGHVYPVRAQRTGNRFRIIALANCYVQQQLLSGPVDTTPQQPVPSGGGSGEAKAKDRVTGSRSDTYLLAPSAAMSKTSSSLSSSTSAVSYLVSPPSLSNKCDISCSNESRRFGVSDSDMGKRTERNGKTFVAKLPISTTPAMHCDSSNPLVSDHCDGDRPEASTFRPIRRSRLPYGPRIQQNNYIVSGASDKG